MLKGSIVNLNLTLYDNDAVSLAYTVPRIGEYTVETGSESTYELLGGSILLKTDLSPPEISDNSTTTLTYQGFVTDEWQSFSGSFSSNELTTFSIDLKRNFDPIFREDNDAALLSYEAAIIPVELEYTVETGSELDWELFYGFEFDMLTETGSECVVELTSPSRLEYTVETGSESTYVIPQDLAYEIETGSESTYVIPQELAYGIESGSESSYELFVIPPIFLEYDAESGSESNYELDVPPPILVEYEIETGSESSYELFAPSTPFFEFVINTGSACRHHYGEGDLDGINICISAHNQWFIDYDNVFEIADNQNKDLFGDCMHSMWTSDYVLENAWHMEPEPSESGSEMVFEFVPPPAELEFTTETGSESIFEVADNNVCFICDGYAGPISPFVDFNIGVPLPTCPDDYIHTTSMSSSFVLGAVPLFESDNEYGSVCSFTLTVEPIFQYCFDAGSESTFFLSVGHTFETENGSEMSWGFDDEFPLEPFEHGSELDYFLQQGDPKVRFITPEDSCLPNELETEGQDKVTMEYTPFRSKVEAECFFDFEED